MTWKRIVIPALIAILLLALLYPEWRTEEPPAGPAAPSGDDPVAQGEPVPPPELEARDECVIVVRDREGRPCRAAVYATGLGGRPPNWADWIGETGADGRLAQSDFQIRPRGSVFAVAPGRVAAPVPIGPSGAELVLGDGVVVTGTVRDKNDQPLPGVLIIAGERHLHPVRTASDRKGRFRVTGLLPGSFGVGGSVERFSSTVAVEPAAWDETVEVTLDGFPVPGDSALLDVRYSVPPEAHPQLILRTGKRESTRWLPRADALVRVDAEEGREIEVVCPGFRSAKARLPAGEETVRLDLVAGPGMPRSLFVVDPEGRPVPGALVLLTRNAEDHYPKSPCTGPDGRLPLGAHHRGFFAIASAEAGASERTRIAEGSEEIVLALRPAAILTGKVIDRDTGEPVPGVRVRLQGGDCGCCSPWYASTDENGEYRFSGIPPGLFVQPLAAGTRQDQPKSHAEALARRLGHLVKGTEIARFADLLVTRYPTVTCRFRIEPAVPGEIVIVEDFIDGGTRYPRMDDDGVVSVEVRTGRRLFLFKSGDLVGVAESTDTEAHLVPRARVYAVLVGPGGKPVPPGAPQWVNVRANLRVDGDRRRITWGGENTGYSDGRADLTGDLLAIGPAEIENVVTLPQGRFQLRDGPFRITSSELAARLREEGGKVVLELPVVERDHNPPVPVVVVDREGRPVPGVRIGDPDEPEDAVVTDDAGRAVIRRYSRPLLPWTGDWRLPDSAGEEPVRLVVERGRRVRLRFVGPRGEPVTGQWVEDVDESLFEETDEEGRIDVVLPLRIDPLVLRSDNWWFGAVNLPSGVVAARPRRPLDVTVRGPKELAVERRLLTLWEVVAPPGTESAGSDRIDQQGDLWRTRLALPPFPGKVRVVTSNLRYEARAEALPGVSKLDLRLARLPDHQVTLVLLGPDGRPLAAREVRCDDALFTTGALVPRGAKTDEAGRLVLPLPEGTHRLREVEVGDLRAGEVRFSSPAPGNVEVRLARR